MAKRGEVKSHQRALKKCLPKLVEDLNVDRVMDFVLKKEIINEIKIRDIREQVTTSQKVRMLVNCLLKKNEPEYEKFKDCLEESGQSSIIDILEGEEREIEAEYIMTEARNETTLVNFKRPPTLQLMSSLRPNLSTIASLSKGSINWTICARLVAKNNIKRKMNQNGRYGGFIDYFSVILVDKTREIRAVFFKNAVKKFYKYYQKLKLQQIYYVSGASVTDANQKYHRVPTELKIKNKTKIKRCRDAVDLPRIPEHDFVEINELKNVQLDELVDVIGVVHYIGKIKTVQTVIKDGETKRELDLVDKNGMVVTVTFWGRNARIFSLRGNPVLALLGVKVTDWQGISLSRQSSTQVYINPGVDKGRSLRKWYDSKGKRMKFIYAN